MYLCKCCYISKGAVLLGIDFLGTIFLGTNLFNKCHSTLKWIHWFCPGRNISIVNCLFDKKKLHNLDRRFTNKTDI